MNKTRAAVHLGVQIVVAATVTKITNDIINKCVDVDSNLDRVRVRIGSAVLGMAVSDLVSDHINRQIDLGIDTVQSYKEVKRLRSIDTPDDLDTAA
jgi:predicted lipoprotein